MSAIFRASVDNNRAVVIERDGLPGRSGFRLTMTPSEADKAATLVSFVPGAEQTGALPDFIENSPFVVRFFPRNEGCALERQDIGGSIPFRANEADDLIKTLRIGRDMAVNAQQLQGPARPVGLRTAFAHDEVLG